MTDAEARDEEYRVAWIEHFVASGEFERARELGWDGEAETAVAETAVAAGWGCSQLLPTMLRPVSAAQYCRTCSKTLAKR